MRQVILALSALAVFLLMIVMFASLSVASPTAGRDRCKTCHPVPHVEGFAERGHAEQILSDPQAQEACGTCHQQQFCSSCHP